MTAITRSNAVLHRDAALARIGRARRWVIAGAAGLTGGLAAFVSATAHGHTLHKGAVTATPAPARATRSSAPSVQMPPLASPNSLGLQGPVQDPQPPSSGSGQSQSNSSPSQSQSPAASAPAPAPAPAPSGGAVVSGGS